MGLFKKKSTQRSAEYEQVKAAYEAVEAKVKADRANATQSELGVAMMYGYALDMVDDAKKNMHVELDFSDESVKQVERIIMQYHASLTDAVPEELIVQNSKVLGAYIGTVAAINHNWQWSLVVDESTGRPGGLLIGPDGQELNVIGKVAKQLRDGEAESVWAMYSILVSKSAKEVSIDELLAKAKK